MKTSVPKVLLMAVVLLCTITAFSQAVISSETFPNAFNGGNGTFAGNQGTWTVTTTNNLTTKVDAANFVSSPRALQFKVNSASASTGNSVTSPIVNLGFGSCQPTSASFSFSVLPEDVDNGNTNFSIALEFFNGTSWISVWSKTADQLYDTYVADGIADDWENVSLSLTSSYWTSSFKYRFVVNKSATSINAYNSSEVWIDDVQIGTVTSGPAYPNFSDATPTKIIDGGAAGGGFEAGDVYKFDNVVSLPENIYAEIKIEKIVNATIVNLDNNAEGIAQRFQPRIAPSAATLTSDAEGYVQFAITFKKVSNNAVVILNGLRYRHFDIDGNQVNTGGDRYTFRETGWVMGQTGLFVNSPTDLTLVPGGVTDTYGTWSKVLGEMDEHDGVSSDADVYLTAAYGSSSTIRFRLGYIFDETAGNVTFVPGATGREYATEFGCFDINNNVALPLTLLSFSGTYQNNHALLSWTTEHEVNVDRFEVERSLDGRNFSKVGTVAPKGKNDGRNSYQLTDELAGVSGNFIYYRLKSVDIDGQYTYSKIIGLYKDEKIANQVSVAPNPVVNGNATIRISSVAKGTADMRIIDLAGRTVKTQKLSLYEGSNAVSIGDLGRLTAGIYTVMVIKDGESFNTKFIVSK